MRHAPHECLPMRFDARHAARAALASAASLLALAACTGTPTSPARPGDLSSSSATTTTPPGYTITDLGTLGGSFSFAVGINDAGHVSGGANTSDEVQHFFLWRDGHLIDAGSLGGNANAGGPTGWDELGGMSETADADPNGEDLCGYGTHRTCLAAVWQRGVITALPTLSGHNAAAFNVNGLGQVVGLAETDVRDPSCMEGTPFQVFRYLPVVWGPRQGDIHALPLLPGDEAGFAFAMNDNGQVVGSTGSCATTSATGRIAGPHAVLWDRGQAVPLDEPGANFAISTAAFINNRGDVVGASGTDALISFLWTRSAGKRYLGALPGDLGSIAAWVNSHGQIVGTSCVNDAMCNIVNPTVVTRAYLWQNGVMTDLNSLVVGGASMYLLTACAINDSGQIVGLAFDPQTFEAHAYLATPVSAGPTGEVARATTLVQRPALLPARVRALIGRSLRLGADGAL